LQAIDFTGEFDRTREKVAKVDWEDLDGDVKSATRHDIEIAGDWQAIEAQLPTNWRELGPAHGVDPASSRAGAKVRDLAVLLRLVFFHVGANASLATTTAMAAAANLVTMSHVALHQWMTKLGPYLEALLGAMTDAARQFAREKWAGYQIFLVDATAVTRPAAPGTTARVHYALRLSDLHPVQADVTDDKGGETLLRFVEHAGPGQLWIGDRGYANPPGIAALVDQGADVMVRWNRGSLPLFDIQDQRIDLRDRLGELEPGAAREWTVWIHPKKHEPIMGRICAVRLPADKAEEARSRLRREQDGDVSAEALELAEFVVVFTTVPSAVFSAEVVLELYQLRWQVELSIKRDKSIAGLDRLPNFRPDTIRAWILTKMLLVQIAHKISKAEICAPPCTAAA
jgi:hypothetical protein